MFIHLCLNLKNQAILPIWAKWPDKTEAKISLSIGPSPKLHYQVDYRLRRIGEWS